MSIYTPGCGTPPPPICNDCPTKELGGLRHFWVQKATYSFVDITDPTEWATAICNLDVYVFPYSNGTVVPSPTMTDGYGNVPQTLDSYDYTAELAEPQYANNVPFANFIKNSNQFLFGYCTQTQGHLSSVAAMYAPHPEVAKDVKSKIDMKYTVKWVQEDLIVPFTYPQEIFIVCQDCV